MMGQLLASNWLTYYTSTIAAMQMNIVVILLTFSAYTERSFCNSKLQVIGSFDKTDLDSSATYRQ